MIDIKNSLQLLDHALCNTAEPIVFLFGAGISASLAGKNYSWEQWVRDGVELLSDEQQRQMYCEKLGDIPGKQASPPADTLVSVLEDLIPDLHTRVGTYEKWMHNAFETLQVEDKTLAKTLKRLLTFQDLFVTTNYDDLLEQATGIKAASYLHPEIVYTMLEARKNTHTIHIHGRYSTKPGDTEDSIIATDTQYNAILANQGAQFIQNVIGTKTIIFVGCGKTTSDKNVSRFITFAKKYLKLDKPSYFLYKADAQPDDLPENIRPVCYGDDYSDLPPFLAAVAAARLEAFTKKHSFIELFPAAITSEQRNTFVSYYFAAEELSFHGRSHELSVIDRFLAETAPCLWYGVTGQSGSGKSRLALEVCHKYENIWCSFFIKPYSAFAQIDGFVPYRDTLIIIDDFKGSEKNVAALIEQLSTLFSPTGYRLRILLCERESTAIFGTWFEELERSFERNYLPVFRANRYGGTAQEFLVLNDLQDKEVEAVIGEICEKHGLPADGKRDKELREAYKKKLEQLHYRPLFLQMYVESWINNGCAATRFDSSTELLEDILKREQERWFQELGNDYKLFNSWINLLLLSAVGRRLTKETIPAKYAPDFDAILSYVKDHSFPGKQRQERFISLVADMCHSIGQEDAYIELMYPDLIKEYCFLYYLDMEQVTAFSKDAWDFAPGNFSAFLIKILRDFPYNDLAYLALNGDESYRYRTETLMARIHALDNSILQKGDSLEQIHTWVDREYQFWNQLAKADDGSDEKRTICIFLGLDMVAQQYGAQDAPWNSTVDKMLSIYDEALYLKGGEALDTIKMIQTQKLAQRLSIAGMADQATSLLGKVNSVMTTQFGAELAKETKLEQCNTEMMDRILNQDFPSAYKVLKKAAGYAEQLNSAETLAYFLGMCHRFGQLSRQMERKHFIDKSEYLAGLTAEKFENDSEVICKRHLIRINRITYDFFENGKRDQKEELVSIFNYAIGVSGSAANECLGTTGILLLNYADGAEEIEGYRENIRTRLESLEPNEGSGDFLAQAYLHCMMTLKKATGQLLFRKAQINEAYALMLRYPDSESIRGLFMDMLEDSVVAENRSRYLRREVITAAISDARYNPMNFSGIDEFDF